MSSTSPTRSVARTSNRCSPTARPVYWRGEVQLAQAPPSSLHSKEPSSSAEKLKIALVLCVVAIGPESTIVSGGVWSITVQA